MESLPNSLTSEIRDCLRICLDRYVLPLSGMSPFGFIPFGVYAHPASEAETYREWHDGLVFRFFMPANHEQQIHHGLGGHWMSWAHALASLGDLLDDPHAISLAWKQIHWVTGQNLHNACLISGLGFNNPMPHSRLLGTFPGGFCSGFIGTPDDTPHLDLNADAQWNTTEYWMTPLGNMFLALTLLGGSNNQPTDGKLGRPAPQPPPCPHWLSRGHHDPCEALRSSRQNRMAFCPGFLHKAWSVAQSHHGFFVLNAISNASNDG